MDAATACRMGGCQSAARTSLGTPENTSPDRSVKALYHRGQPRGPLRKTSLDTAWQRFITLAIADGNIDPEDRFALHDLKRRGITDTTGTRADKQEASGHRDAKMMDVYDHSVPVVSPSAE